MPVALTATATGLDAPMTASTKTAFAANAEPTGGEDDNPLRTLLGIKGRTRTNMRVRRCRFQDKPDAVSLPAGYHPMGIKTRESRDLCAYRAWERADAVGMVRPGLQAYRPPRVDRRPIGRRPAVYG